MKGFELSQLVAQRALAEKAYIEFLLVCMRYRQAAWTHNSRTPRTKCTMSSVDEPPSR
jgi:hypothetical protein